LGFGFRVQGSGFRVQGSGFRVQGSGFRVQGSGFRVQGSGFGLQGLRFTSEATTSTTSPCVQWAGWRRDISCICQGCTTPTEVLLLGFWCSGFDVASSVVRGVPASMLIDAHRRNPPGVLARHKRHSMVMGAGLNATS
ncbi:hypothetical protein T484DRAFT_1638678, partial [Baffinella frigidus]